MDGHISFWINDHGQGRVVPKLCDVLGVTRPSTLVLDHLEGRGGSSVVDAQGVGHLGVRGGDCKVTRDCEIGGRDVTKIVEPRWRGEIPVQGRVASDCEVLSGRG